jgi:hypothetical protein
VNEAVFIEDGSIKVNKANRNTLRGRSQVQSSAVGRQAQAAADCHDLAGPSEFQPFVKEFVKFIPAEAGRLSVVPWNSFQQFNGD